MTAQKVLVIIPLCGCQRGPRVESERFSLQLYQGAVRLHCWQLAAGCLSNSVSKRWGQGDREAQPKKKLLQAFSLTVGQQLFFSRIQKTMQVLIYSDNGQFPWGIGNRSECLIFLLLSNTVFLTLVLFTFRLRYEFFALGGWGRSGCPVHCKMFSSISSLYPLDSRSDHSTTMTPHLGVVTTENVQTLPSISRKWAVAPT